MTFRRLRVILSRAIVLAAIAAAVYFGHRELQRRETARLWGRLSACLIGKGLADDEPLRRRLLGIRRAVLRHTPRNQQPDWPARCEEHQRAVSSSTAVRTLAPALASAAATLTLRWKEEDELPVADFEPVFRAGAGVRASPADADVIRPPPPMAPAVELVALADAPSGVKVSLERTDPRTPVVSIGDPDGPSCTFDADWKTARCGPRDPSPAPAAATKPGPLSRSLGTWRDPDGTFVDVREEPTSLEDELITLERVAPDGKVTRTPYPYPTKSGQIALFGGWLLSIDRAPRGEYVVHMRRLPSASAWLGPPIQVSVGSASPHPFRSCTRSDGQIVMLGIHGEPKYGSNDPVIALFESKGSWRTAGGAVARAFADPGPVFDPAALSCDDEGAWLSWTDRTGHMFTVQCTPEGCKRFTPWPLPGIAIPNSRVIKLGGRVVLVATTTRPWGIVMRAGEADRIPALEESCLIEDASLVDVVAHDDRALIVVRSESGKLAALRLDATGNAMPVLPSP